MTTVAKVEANQKAPEEDAFRVLYCSFSVPRQRATDREQLKFGERRRAGRLSLPPWAIRNESCVRAPGSVPTTTTTTTKIAAARAFHVRQAATLPLPLLSPSPAVPLHACLAGRLRGVGVLFFACTTERGCFMQSYFPAVAPALRNVITTFKSSQCGRAYS